MEYGAIIKQSWQMVWRRKFLWLLGMFAGSSAGGCNGSGFGNSGTSGGGGDFGVGTGPTSDQVATWLQANMGLLIGIGLGLLLVILALIVVSFIARGGLTYATLELGQGRTGKPAWRAGTRYFWRFVGIALIQFAVVMAFIIIVVGLVLFAVGIGVALNRELGIAVGVLAALVILGLVLLLIPVSILAHIIIMYAERAMIDRDMGPISSIGEGWRIFRTRFGESLLVWLISVGLGIGIGIVTFLAVFVLLIPLGGIGVLLYMSIQFATATIVYLVVAGLLLFVALWVLGGIVNSYFFSYWSLSYLQITGRQTEPVAA